MKNVTVKNVQREETIEDLLEAAGFDFAIVQRCPETGCHLCSQTDLAAAA
jgi:hypothetical protein